jgi:hypothetical protein
MRTTKLFKLKKGNNNWGDYVGFPNLFRYAWNFFTQSCLETACDGAINTWLREKPEYIDKVRNWIKTDTIPDDRDLQTLCKIYQEKVRPRH